MPGYNAHRLFNYAMFIMISAILYADDLPFLNPALFLALCAGFYAGTEFITPDLDVESRASGRWGGLSAIWLPYRLLFRHGKSSHNIVYGAVVRLLYIGIIILGVYYIVFRALPSDMMILPPEYVLIFLAGIVSANALHVMLDMLL